MIHDGSSRNAVAARDKREERDSRDALALFYLARIIHGGFYDNRRYAVPTDVLATQSVNILFKYASLLPGCACPSHDASQRFRHESS
jgi:hypothetical protein